MLSAITLRMVQKLSLLHGFEYSTEDENIGLLIAAASAAGVDLGRDFIEKQAAERLVPWLVDRIAVRLGAEVAEKWAGRIFPVVSAGAGATINYYFVRGWGRRAQKHFLARHQSVIGAVVGSGGSRAAELVRSSSRVAVLPSRLRLASPLNFRLMHGTLPRPLTRRNLPVNTIELARYLIGKTLVREFRGTILSGRIVETEAYPWRRRGTRLARAHARQPDSVPQARPRLHLLHLWRALVLQRDQRARGNRRRCAAARHRATRRN